MVKLNTPTRRQLDLLGADESLIRNFENLFRFAVPIDTTDLTGGEVPTWSITDQEWIAQTGGGGGGQVDSVIGGTDITVDASDPANPIVNFDGLGSFTTDDLGEGSTNLYNRLPAGGVAGQVLEKIDGTDYNAQWVTPSNGTYYEVIWAEEGGTLNTGTASGYQFSFGNGATNQQNGASIIVPAGYTCEWIGMSHNSSGATTATITAVLNAVDQTQNISIASVATPFSSTTIFGTPIAVSDGDVVNFRTTSVTTTASPNVVSALLRFTSTSGGGGGGGQVDSVVGGVDITVDSSDPVNPIVNFNNSTGYITNLSSFDTDDLSEGTTNLYNRVPTGGTAAQVLAKIDGTDYNSQWVDVIVGGQVDSVVAGTDISVDASDPVNPIVNFSNASGYITDLSSFTTDDLSEGSSNLYNRLPAGGLANQVLSKIDGTDYNAQWITSPSGGQVDSVVGGTNITVDASDPVNPIVNFDGLGAFTSDNLSEGSTNLYNRVPIGGSAGQVLEKIDGTDYNTQWVTPSGGASFNYVLYANTNTATNLNTVAYTAIPIFGNLLSGALGSDFTLLSATQLQCDFTGEIDIEGFDVTITSGGTRNSIRGRISVGGVQYGGAPVTYIRNSTGHNQDNLTLGTILTVSVTNGDIVELQTQRAGSNATSTTMVSAGTSTIRVQRRS